MTGTEGGKMALRNLRVFAGTLALCIVLLLLASLIPDSWISKNLRESSRQLVTEEEYQKIFDHTHSAMLDNHTEAVILMEAGSMNSPESVFLNPYYEQEDLPLNRVFFNHEEGWDCETVFYVRYWMGFRALLRPILVLLHYFEIRQYLSLTLFALFLAAVLSAARNASTGSAFLLGLSFLLVRPQIICQNIQFSTCFILAFGFMLLIPWISRHPGWEQPAFLVFGMLTMYFDFYTTPLVTLGYPLLYLLILRERRTPLRSAAADGGLWLLGYGGMWLARLGLTALVTPVNGFADGLGAMAYWLGSEGGISPLKAISQVHMVFYVDNRSRALIWAVLLTAAVTALVLWRRRRYSFRRAFGDPALLLLGLTPWLWFLAAARPTYVHAWFQYRSIAVGFWALGLQYFRGFEKQK